jgi:hypothetical protein
MSEPLWTEVGEDTGQEVLAMNAAGEFNIGYVVREPGYWWCEGECGMLDKVTHYIPLSKLVALSKIKPVEKQSHVLHIKSRHNPLHQPKGGDTNGEAEEIGWQ